VSPSPSRHDRSDHYLDACRSANLQVAVKTMKAHYVGALDGRRARAIGHVGRRPKESPVVGETPLPLLDHPRPWHAVSSLCSGEASTMITGVAMEVDGRRCI
jgi:hypothetical protein